ncbi:hypothetical protein Bca101_058872 [Brassica carinata]
MVAMKLVPNHDEITKVMMKLNADKSPGLDGLTSGFFKASWSLLGPEVINSIKSFFNSGFLSTAENSTILSLVRKKPGASLVIDYRPISCCNTVYKVISKLLVNRLKPLLPALILPNQTAFVQGCLLVENTVLASEIVHGYHRNRGPKRIVLKVDIAKAFDTIHWDFIFNCLGSIGVPGIYLQWLKDCVCSPSFNIGYNGTVQGYFKSKRGLRQGDPLSPYLFFIAMNCLFHLLNNAAKEGRISYHHRCTDSKLTHLCFADDLLIFCHGSLRSIKGALDVLANFQSRPGLAISITKTCFFSSDLSEQEIDEIKQETGLPYGQLPIRYLGVPLCTKKLSMANFEPLIQSVKTKLTSWTTRTLSFAGRLLLINTVISGTLDGQHTAKVFWEEITHSKEEGGLGMRDLLTWNKACSMKLIWMLFFRSGSIWVAWFTREILDDNISNFWTLKEKANHFWVLTDANDSFEWILDGSKCANFSTGKLYREIKHHNNIVPWLKIIWFSSGILRHSFLTWLFMLNRCPTRDRMIDWGLQVPAACLLCNANPESRDHLFFSCSYSMQVWAPVAARSDLAPSSSWTQPSLCSST